MKNPNPKKLNNTSEIKDPYFIVVIKKSDAVLGLTEGEVYIATKYDFDPFKVSLYKRLPDGLDPMCNQYLHEVEIYD